MGYAAEYSYKISKISTKVKSRMIKGNSWKKGCPVPLSKLRYLELGYIDFNGVSQQGELIVHEDVAEDVTKIFEALYFIGYPIKSMQLVSDYKGNDFQSIEADNTSAFNCRAITGNSKKWSNHAYGKAIDINPIENPYISRKGTCSHIKSKPYLPNKRKQYNTLQIGPVLLENSQVVNTFKDFGWKWGGDWRTIKDYQHFEKK